MRRSTRFVSSVVLLLACGTEPSSGPLTGQFGGQLSDGMRALLTLSDTAAQVRLPCATVRLTAPVVADSAGRFVASGLWQASTTVVAPAQLTGVAHGRTLDVTVTVSATVPVQWSGQLRQGNVPSFNDFCPQ
jgi:hypothetical protein